MDKAYVDFEALFRIHNAGAFFVTSAKDAMRYEIVEQNFNINETTGLRTGKTVLPTVPKSKKLYPEKLRSVEFYDATNDEPLVFLTNNFDALPLEVACLYKNRRQIAVFYKRIKQHLAVEKLWGHSVNAVKTHVWIAIRTYLTVAYVKYALKSNLSICRIMQILGVSVFDKTPVKELLAEQLHFNQNGKELQYNLFDDLFEK